MGLLFFYESLHTRLSVFKHYYFTASGRHSNSQVS